MTALPEAKLAREAEICYATMALVTDYDVWHHSEEKVSVELVVANLLRNVKTSQEIVGQLVPRIPDHRDCGCSSALKDAIITNPDYISESARNRVALLIDKYIKTREEVR